MSCSTSCAVPTYTDVEIHTTPGAEEAEEESPLRQARCLCTTPKEEVEEKVEEEAEEEAEEEVGEAEEAEEAVEEERRRRRRRRRRRGKRRRSSL